ncbi:cytochrome P450 [Paractinoplanes durhamensis]|uniref:Cytochrome P450 n=1 Tax=Paractinoplanes durhamensis TaxID=113563 RepID=A0ABQ3Z5J7_9ACTN|nr:cytochrome P450 [Actinoplanes durhamensis]GIE05109.1 cytochrome P450 [Actinoplanes durhamensis]
MQKTFSSVRLRLLGWAARRFAGKAGSISFGGSLSMLPDSSLFPLFRDGLDPVAEVGTLREQEPVSRLPLPLGVRAWLVTGYEPVRAVLGSPDGFSNDFGRFAAQVGLDAGREPGGLGMSDPPMHTRLRRLIMPEFTMHRLARLQPRIDAIVTERLDAMSRSTGPVDLWQEFALPVPALTICELLGVPYADQALVQQFSTARFDLGDGAYAPLDAINESRAYLRGLVADQRRKPGDGLIGSLIRDHGDELDDQELAGLADGVLTGGLETSASMLALGALVLMTQPGLAAPLRRGESPDALVEELLRYLTVVQVAFPRFAVRDLEVAGASIKAGDMVMCSLSAADRDAVLGPGMDEIDAGRRTSRSHLAFGHGLHRCVGAELARMELRIAYPALVRRFPAMRPAIDPAELPMRRASIVFGLDALPVDLGPVPPPL